MTLSCAIVALLWSRDLAGLLFCTAPFRADGAQNRLFLSRAKAPLTRCHRYFSTSTSYSALGQEPRGLARPTADAVYDRRLNATA